MAITTADLVQKFLTLNEQKKSAEENLDELKSKLKVLETELLDRFERASIDRMGSNGHTLYIHRQLWAKNEVDAPYTVLALKAAGLDDLVEEKSNSQRVSAYVREIAKEHEINGIPLTPEQIRTFLPESLQPALSVTENITLRVRKG